MLNYYTQGTNNAMNRIVIIGATSAIAEQCARIWLTEQAIDLTLVGRDVQHMQTIADDLKVRSIQSTINFIKTDFLHPEIISSIVNEISQAGQIDIVLIAHGFLPQQTQCQNDLQACRDALEINGISPVLYAEAFATKMAQANHGTIAIIGSIAGDRGRKSNYIYGSAKGLITRYAEGLQHRFFGTNVKIVLIKPGPTDTPMTAYLKNRGIKLAPISQVAAQIVHGIKSGKSLIYTPKKWKLIMMAIRHLPNFIFNRLNI